LWIIRAVITERSALTAMSRANRKPTAEERKKQEEIELLRNYLGVYRRAKRRELRLEKRLKEIREDMERPIGGINYDPINKPQNQIGAGAASFTFRTSDCELRIYEQRDRVQKDLLKILDIFDYLDKDTDERNALELHYIDGLSWCHVAEELPCSERHIYNIRDRALEKLLTFKRVKKIIHEYEADEEEEIRD
jgi:predicted DNA-binding protein YlxM (UPF0122 family)